MKKLFFIVLLVSSTFSVHCQKKDSSNVLDKVYISETFYDLDTTISFYSNAQFYWIDSVGGSSLYEFLEGNKTYCEVSIQKTCKCHDGSSHQLIIIEYDNHDSSQVVQLSPANTTWLIRNVMIYNPHLTNFSGKLDFENHTLEFYPTVDLNRNIRTDGIIFKNILLTKP